jgi:hypothetical protein
MFKSLFRKIEHVISSDEYDETSEEKFFSNVVGYPEIKKLLLRSIVSNEPVHVTRFNI